ncbi:hypothetical protein [Natrialba chahannaoensis]|uniref:hypothetical protein n=1 Tax=Natrialba chahannaoensis TaxID=68911 RepID=UPI000AE4A7DD|nr:hypothetical protein [Natrialba chahannaoensis]
MSDNKSNKGDVIKLDTSRRRLLKTFGGAGVGITGFKSAIETVTGESHDGVPVVYTRDKQGRPEQVRLVPQERYRRLKVFCDLDQQSFFEHHSNVNEITLVQHSEKEEDIGIQLQVDENSAREQQKLPDEIYNVPVSYEEKSVGYCGFDDGDDGPCDNPKNEARICEQFDGLKGGSQISDMSSFGTLCLVAKDKDEDYKKIITAEHVMDESANNIHHPSYTCSSSKTIGEYDDDDTDDDIWAAKLDSDSASADIGETVDEIPNITGYWTWEGLSDYTIRNSVQCLVAGARTKIKENYANSTSYTGSYVDHQVVYGSDKAEKGDSGAPYVDFDGKLVSMNNACRYSEYPPDAWDVGTQAEYVLDAVNATLD